MRFKGRVYRAHNPRWSFSPTSGEGAARHGGRFNPVGLPALYSSLRMETAWLEAQQGFAFKPQPLTICAYEVDSDPIRDLTDPNSLKSLGVTRAELACPWEDLATRGATPPTWVLTRKLIEEGANGALVPSFAPGAAFADVNLVFWRWSDAAPDQVILIDDERRLPRDDSSWR